MLERVVRPADPQAASGGGRPGAPPGRRLSRDCGPGGPKRSGRTGWTAGNARGPRPLSRLENVEAPRTSQSAGPRCSSSEGVPGGGIEPPTRGFPVLAAKWPRPRTLRAFRRRGGASATRSVRRRRARGGPWRAASLHLKEWKARRPESRRGGTGAAPTVKSPRIPSLRLHRPLYRVQPLLELLAASSLLELVEGGGGQELALGALEDGRDLLELSLEGLRGGQEVCEYGR